MAAARCELLVFAALLLATAVIVVRTSLKKSCNSKYDDSKCGRFQVDTGPILEVKFLSTLLQIVYSRWLLNRGVFTRSAKGGEYASATAH